jgi:hypothetical protein
VDFVTWLRSQWDRVVGWTLVGLGIVLLVVGASGVARARFLVDQLSYIISGGLGGLGCVALGAALMVCADHHDEWRMLDRIESLLRERTGDSNNGVATVEAKTPNGQRRQTETDRVGSTGSGLQVEGG